MKQASSKIIIAGPCSAESKEQIIETGKNIEKIQEVGFSYDGIIINAGGFTHTSIAIRDAISSVTTPCLEVHISNILSREEFRQNSYLSEVSVGIISGLGMKGYELAIQYFKSK